MSTRILNTPTASVRVYADADELALEAARRFARLAGQYVGERGRFTVALSGGSTPRSMFTILANEPFLDTVPWSSILFFWGDERTVPPDHQESNYRMANETLLSRVRVPRENIFRIPAEGRSPDFAAAAYAESLAQTLDCSTGLPRFDLILLGMGPDGHTASLFPFTTALHVIDRICVANHVGRLQTYRITLTRVSINEARNVTFLVSGADKAEALKAVLEGPAEPYRYPSQLIRPRNGSLLWMADEAAASLLEGC